MTFRRNNYTHHPLSPDEIKRAVLMFGCRRDTMKIRDYLHEERRARGETHFVYEWQVYNALAAWREQRRFPTDEPSYRAKVDDDIELERRESL